MVRVRAEEGEGGLREMSFLLPGPRSGGGGAALLRLSCERLHAPVWGGGREAFGVRAPNRYLQSGRRRRRAEKHAKPWGDK